MLTLYALWDGRPWHRVGIVGNAQHATATTQRDVRPSFAKVVSPILSLHTATWLKRSESRVRYDIFCTEHSMRNYYSDQKFRECSELNGEAR